MNRHTLLVVTSMLLVLLYSLAPSVNAETTILGMSDGQWKVSDDNGQTWNSWDLSNRSSVDIWEARHLYNIPISEKVEVVINSVSSDDRAVVTVNADPSTRNIGTPIPGATQIIFNKSGIGNQWFFNNPDVIATDIVYKNWTSNPEPAYVVSNGLQNITAFVNNTNITGSEALTHAPVKGGPSNVAINGYILTGGGPISRYYLTAGAQQTNFVVQHEAVINQQPQNQTNESAIAVIGTQDRVRTLGNPDSTKGSEYTLDLTYTGVNYNYPITGKEFLDGTSDVQFGGSHNYSVDRQTGDVYRFDQNWANPSFLFTSKDLVGNSLADNVLGITYDPWNTSLWLSEFNGISGNYIYEYSLDGLIKRSFQTGLLNVTALGMDYADRTLWMGSLKTSGIYYQYSVAGAELNSWYYPELYGKTAIGGEFPVPAPEPSSIALFVLGLGTMLRSATGYSPRRNV